MAQEQRGVSVRARRFLAKELQRIAEYETRIQRANAAFMAEADGERRFSLFKALPPSVQIQLWRHGDLVLDEDAAVHNERLEDLEFRIKTDRDLYAMLEDRRVQGSDDSDDDGVGAGDVSWDTLREAYERVKREDRTARLAKRRCIDRRVVYEAAIEHLTGGAPNPSIYPRADDVDGWMDWLRQQPPV